MPERYDSSIGRSLLLRYQAVVDRHYKNCDELLKIEKEKIQNLEAVEFLTNFAEYIREGIKVKLEGLANSALRAIFPDKDMLFRLIGKKTKTGLQYDLYIETDGDITPLHDAKGGGVLDVISIALRISYLKMYQGSLDQVLFLDEPFKNLDEERIVNASEWLHKLSQELSIQFIIVTHISELATHSDKLFRVSMVNGVSNVDAIESV